MRIKEQYQKSIAKKVVDFLFSRDLKLHFTDSIVGSMLSKLDLPTISIIFALTAYFILLYKNFLSGYLPFLSASWLVPLLLTLALIFCNKKSIVFRKYHLWYFGFLIVSALSLLLGAFNHLNIFMLFSGWYLFAQLLLVIIVAQGIPWKKPLLYGILAISAPVFLYGYYQVLMRIDTSAWFSAFESAGTRASGFFDNPNVFGILAGILSLTCICLFFMKKEKRYLLLTLFFGVAMGFSYSRTAWLGFVIAAFIIFSIYFSKFFWQIILLPFFATIIPKVRERISVVFTGNYLFDSSLDGRIWSIINGIFLWKQKMFFGWGPGSYGGKTALTNASPVYLSGIQNGYTALYFTDNQYIEILVQTGLFGLLAFIGFSVSFTLSMVKRYVVKKNHLLLAALGSFIIFLVSGAFANVLEFGAITVPLGIIIGAAEDEE